MFLECGVGSFQQPLTAQNLQCQGRACRHTLHEARRKMRALVMFPYSSTDSGGVDNPIRATMFPKTSCSILDCLYSLPFPSLISLLYHFFRIFEWLRRTFLPCLDSLRNFSQVTPTDASLTGNCSVDAQDVSPTEDQWHIFLSILRMATRTTPSVFPSWDNISSRVSKS